jgi:hypothetical protein
MWCGCLHCHDYGVCEMQASSLRALELFQEMQQGGLHGVGHRTRGSITVRSWPLHVRAYHPTYRDSTLVSRICQVCSDCHAPTPSSLQR